jgi:hypothetical protein
MSQFRPIRHWIKRRPLAAYVLLAFGMEWLLVLALQAVATPIVAHDRARVSPRALHMHPR